MSLTVTLLGKEHAVVLPRRYGEGRELLQLAFNNSFRGAGAVLATCVPTLELRAKLALCGGSVSEYGAAAWEELHDRGVDDTDMVRAAQPVIDALSERVFPTKAEVAAREGFSAAPQGGPTSAP